MKSQHRSTRPLARALPWLALGFAFGPVLSQFAAELPDIPFGFSAALSPVLLLLAFRGPEVGVMRRRLAGALIAGGLLAELVGIAGGSWSVARLGLPASILGLALWTGAPGPKTAALALWLVPIPTALFLLTSPGVESALAQLGVGTFALLGAQVHASGPLIRVAGGHLELTPFHSGLHLAWVGAALAWYASIRGGATFARGAVRAVRGALLALPLQVVAVWVALALLVSGRAGLASGWLDHGAWLAMAVVGLSWIESASRSGDPDLKPMERPDEGW